jgi:hypothetical protein
MFPKIGDGAINLAPSKKKFENALGEEGFFPAAVLSRQLSPTVSRAID